MRNSLWTAQFPAMLLMAACTTGKATVYTCLDPEMGNKDDEGFPIPCDDDGLGGAGGTEGTGGAMPGKPGTCQQQCMPLGPLGWTREPVLLWIGDKLAAPPCPEQAKSLAYEGYADLVAPAGTCPTCSCGKPLCMLPATLVASSDANCSTAPGTTLTPFDPPADWTGACATARPIPGSQFNSISIAPTTVKDCAPMADAAPPPPPPASWKTFARACQGEAYPPCQNSDEVCSPKAAAGDGFRQCVAYLKAFDEQSPPACPEAYPERHIFHGSYDDTRACSPCACGKPTGSDCKASLTGYPNSTCQDNGLPTFATTAAFGVDVCTATPSTSTDLMSVSAQWLLTNPGTCQPNGGEPTGEARPVAPTVFCCQLPSAP